MSYYIQVGEEYKYHSNLKQNLSIYIQLQAIRSILHSIWAEAIKKKYYRHKNKTMIEGK